MDKELITEVVSGLREIFKENIYEIILYGSVARGEATDESDIDIALILNSDLTERDKKLFLEWNANLDLKFDKVFSIVDVTKDKIEKWGKIVPFYMNIQKEGMVLWKAA